MTVLIVDTSYLIYRSYFAYKNLSNNGFPTGAFFGFTKTILSLIEEYNPQEIIFANDTSKPTWRHEILSTYKADRPQIEDDMVKQIPIIKNWTKKISKNFFSTEGFEADDFICTVCTNLLQKHKETVDRIVIFSSDRDLYQLLVFPEVFFIQVKTIRDGMQLFGREDFKIKYQLEPEQWLDYKTLVGDPSDNLKGVPGIGPKTATKILQKIGCLYNLFSLLGMDSTSFRDLGFGFEDARLFISDVNNKIICEKIVEHYELLKQTYFLATLQNIPGTDISFSGFDLSLGIEDFQKFNFKSLVTIANKHIVRENQPEALF